MISIGSILYTAIALGLALLTTAAAADEDISPTLRKVHVPHANKHRVKVPIHTRLLDAIEGNGNGPQRIIRTDYEQVRHFEIETMDESSNNISTLHAQEIRRMAITAKTTYNFKRKLDADAINFSILSHHSKEHMTILSVDKSSGRVRGLHHELLVGKTRHITNENGDRLHLRSLNEVQGRKEWTCGAVGHDHGHGDDHEKRSFDMNDAFRINSFERRSPENKAQWTAPQKHSFNIDLSIEVDAKFIEEQGGPEQAVEYINFLVSAANMVFEHEVDAHLNVVHIEETDLYDNETNAKEALSLMRMGFKSRDSSSKFRLNHAVLGRYLGGGIAFIDSVCDKDWGFGVISDISGNLENMDDSVLFDFFYFTHEVGHSLGSSHTFDEEYDPPVDACGECAMPGGNATVVGLPKQNSGTIMSYCNFCDGGLSNVAITLGGEWMGINPRNDLTTWENSPLVNGDVSNDPRRVSHFVWSKLNSKGLECTRPEEQFTEIQGCSEDSHCDDNNECTIDACQDNYCTVSDKLKNCCGNGVCELGELGCHDCGPFTIQPEKFCEECFALNGFMFETRLQQSAMRDVFLNSISFRHEVLEDEDVSVSLYYADTPYIDVERPTDWTLISTSVITSRAGSESITIPIDPPLRLNVGSTKAFYVSASRDVILFGQGEYLIQNHHGLELYSSRAVTSSGDGINGFSLSCSVEYVINDSLSTKSPTSSPLVPPYALIQKKIDQAPGDSDSQSSDTLLNQGERDQYSQDNSSKSEATGQIQYLTSALLLVLCNLIANMR